MRLERAPLLPVALVLAAGIAGGAWLAVPPLLAAEVAAGALALATLGTARGSHGAATAALLAALLAIGALRGSAPALPREHVARLLLPSVALLEGRLAEEPVRFAPDRQRILLDVEAYRAGPERVSASGLVQITVYGPAAALGLGQRVAVRTRPHRPIGFRNPGGFDYPAHLRREGILLVGSARTDDVVALAPDEPPWPIRFRRWAVSTIAAELPESSAALLAGLLLGERTALPRDTDENFRRAGVYHVLAVSGFNVALITSSVFAALSLLGAPRRISAVVAAVALVSFALVVGGQPSVLRATVMGLMLLGGVLLERPSQLVNALCLAAIALVLWRPADLWDPGFQLSFAATAGIAHLAGPLTAWLGERGWPRWLAAGVAVSLAAQLPVTPVMAAHFNQLSVIGVVANLAVVPLAGPATTLGMLALLAHPLSELGSSLVFNAVWLLLAVLRGVVWAAAAVPGAMVHLPAPSWIAATSWLGALLLLPSARIRLARVAALGLLAVALAASAWPWLRPGDGRLHIAFLDVGQGDATFIELPGGERLLIDGGAGGNRRFDVGERVLSPFLWNHPVGRLDAIALSHADADHAGGLGAVLRHFSVGEFWESGRWTPGGADTLRALERSRTPRRVLSAGQRLGIGGAVLTVVGPDGQPGFSVNDDSLVLRLDWRGVSVLVTGDLGWAGEARAVEQGRVERVLVLRVGHHGSRSSSTAAFLDAARPSFAVISVGARNPFRHPSPETLARLGAAGARVYRTDRDGAILLETDGSTLWVTRWARGDTEAFDLGRERPPPGAARDPAPGAHQEDTDGTVGGAPARKNTAASGVAGGRSGTRGERERVTSRDSFRSGCASAPAPRDRDACPGRAPSLRGSS